MSTGIYKIENKINKKIYIGSTSKSFTARWDSHKRNLNGGRHPNKYLQEDWKNYGEFNFQFDIIEEISSVEDIVTRENYYISLFYDNCNNCYNVSHKATSFRGNSSVKSTKITIEYFPPRELFDIPQTTLGEIHSLKQQVKKIMQRTINPLYIPDKWIIKTKKKY